MVLTAAEFVKQTTSIPERFVDELFEFYNENTLPTECVINLNNVSKWLHVSKKQLSKTVRTSYKKNIDYTITAIKNTNKDAPNSNNHVQYMLSPDCFKQLCMKSNAKNGEAVRQYFIEVESTFIKYRQQLLNGMELENKQLRFNQRPKNADPVTGYIYVFKAHETLGLYRIGRSDNIKRRIREHQSSHADDIDVLYRFRTDDLKFVESCVHKALKDKQYRKLKEVFEADPDLIKMLLNQCDGVICARKEFESRKAPKQQGGYFIMFSPAKE